MHSKGIETEPLISPNNHRSYNANTNGDVENALKSLSYSEKITFTWSEVNVFTLESTKPKRGFLGCGFGDGHINGQGKQILKNVNGIARPGELLAILGSSGAGKTTLLNVLTARSASRMVVSGLRCANGVPISSNALTSKLAYVQQDDLFIGTLTVKEHLIFQALVRMDRHIPYKQRMERVNEVIIELGLSKCENTTIGITGRIKGISGGEMKRLSFAAEVLTNPSLMFCDEPTSGLDSFMAMNVVQVLKRLAQLGKTVVCTIHQPSSELYAMFDKILLVAEGRVAFLGTPKEAELFFASLDAPCPPNYNPADYFVQLLAIIPGREESCKQAVNMICDGFARSDYGVKLAVEAATVEEYKFGDYFNGRRKTTPYKASWCTQFGAVLWRSWLSVIKEPLLIKVRLIQTFIMAAVVALIYFGQILTEEGVMNINGVIYLFITNMTFQNLFSVIHVFCAELPVFLREHRNGMYRTDVYFLSKTLADLPLFVAIPVITICICYFSIGLNPDASHFFTAAGILVLVANAAVSFGYFVSCLSSSVDMAMSLAAPMMIPVMLFGGFFINLDSIPKYFQWLSYLSWLRYGYEGLMVNQWSDIGYINCTGSETCPKNGSVILDIYHFSVDNVTADCISLLGLICFFRIMAYLALLLKTYTIE
ncbi:protein white-like isoform X2 [Photinus pyralis]|uniref:protein white-like isoform X2 n=1 Tax=Photinus pyralis TaxID=7054 RepID=UPI001266ED66|nr:protein white-like isoform X2 [Photinus pyralis]